MVLKKQIKNCDLFSKEVNLNLNGKTHHSTLCGGVITVVVGLFICFIVYLDCSKLINYEGDQINTY